MKKRSAEILRRLIESPSHRLRLSALMDDYRISEKTLRADIAAAAAFAQDPRGNSMVEVSSEHVCLAMGSDVAGLDELLDSMDLYDYRLSFDERKYFIACTLLALPDGAFCSMQSLADAMYVTRNTVIADMKTVEDYLAGYGIVLLSKSKRGMCVLATTEQRRDLLIDVHVALLEDRFARHDYFSHLVAGVLESPVDIDSVLDAVHLFLKTHNIFLALEVEREIVACLATLSLYLNKMPVQTCDNDRGSRSEALVQPLDTIGELIRFVMARIGFDNLANPQIVQAERVVLARDLSPQIKRFDDFDLYCVVTRFLFLVGRGLDIDIQNDNLLVESLLSHLKSMSNWSSDAFEVEVAGPSGMTVSMVQNAAAPHFHVLEDYLRRSMDDSMRSSVVIHICAALYRSESGMRECNVLVACPSSVATSKYLEAQIKTYFKLSVVGAVSTRAIDAGEVSLDGVDFVVSTVALELADVPVVVVSPVLSVEDINKIQAQAFKSSKTDPFLSQGQGSMLGKLYEIYAQGNPRKTAYLNRALSHALEEVERIEREVASTSPLLRMLERRFICVDPKERTWRDGMSRASEGLLQEGYFTRGYVDRAIGNVEEYGSYIILNQGIALGHAGSKDGVFKSGLGLLVSREGIVFDEGERVHLMFFFSQVGDGDYLELFREIIKLGNDREGLTRVCDASDADEAYQALVEMLTEYA